MKLSVVIPTLNEEKFLPILLSSFENQTNKDFEVLVVDSHSEDKTKEKAEEFKGKFKLSFMEAERKNVAHQRNAGGRAANGKYVAFLDADYKVNKDFVKSCIDAFENSDADMVIPFSYPITQNPLWRMYFSAQNYLCVLSGFTSKPFGVALGNVIKKGAFLKIGGYNEEVYVFEDQYFFQTAKKNKLKIKYTNKIEMYFSLRRIEEDGLRGYFYFNLYAFFYYIFKGPVFKKFYNYKMGGGGKKNN